MTPSCVLVLAMVSLRDILCKHFPSGADRDHMVSLINRFLGGDESALNELDAWVNIK